MSNEFEVKKGLRIVPLENDLDKILKISNDGSVDVVPNFTINTSGCTEDRQLIMPDHDVDLGNLNVASNFIRTLHLTHEDIGSNNIDESIPADTHISHIVVIINTAFNGTTDSLIIGDSVDNDRFVTSSEIDLSQIEKHYQFEYYHYENAAQLTATLTSDATQGDLDIIVYFGVAGATGTGGGIDPLLSAKVDTISGDLDALEIIVGEIQTNVSNISGDLDTLEITVSDLQTDVNTISGDLDSLQSQVDSISGGTIVFANGIELTTLELSGGIPSSLIPDTSGVYDLGSQEKPFRDVYLTNNSLHLGDDVISTSTNNVYINSDRLLLDGDIIPSTDISFDSSGMGGDITGSDVQGVIEEVKNFIDVNKTKVIGNFEAGENITKGLAVSLNDNKVFNGISYTIVDNITQLSTSSEGEIESPFGSRRSRYHVIDDTKRIFVYCTPSAKTIHAHFIENNNGETTLLQSDSYSSGVANNISLLGSTIYNSNKLVVFFLNPTTGVIYYVFASIVGSTITFNSSHSQLSTTFDEIYFSYYNNCFILVDSYDNTKITILIGKTNNTGRIFPITVDTVNETVTEHTVVNTSEYLFGDYMCFAEGKFFITTVYYGYVITRLSDNTVSISAQTLYPSYTSRFPHIIKMNNNKVVIYDTQYFWLVTLSSTSITSISTRYTSTIDYSNGQRQHVGYSEGDSGLTSFVIVYASSATYSNHMLKVRYNIDLTSNIIYTTPELIKDYGISNEFPATVYYNPTNESSELVYVSNTSSYQKIITETSVPTDIIGIADEDATTGTNCQVLLGGISSYQSGLTPNSRYYAYSDGSLSTTDNGNFIGIAKSETELVIYNDKIYPLLQDHQNDDTIHFVMLDEDLLDSNTTLATATQRSIKNYVDVNQPTVSKKFLAAQNISLGEVVSISGDEIYKGLIDNGTQSATQMYTNVTDFSVSKYIGINPSYVSLPVAYSTSTSNYVQMFLFDDDTNSVVDELSTSVPISGGYVLQKLSDDIGSVLYYVEDGYLSARYYEVSTNTLIENNAQTSSISGISTVYANNMGPFVCYDDKFVYVNTSDPENIIFYENSITTVEATYHVIYYAYLQVLSDIYLAVATSNNKIKTYKKNVDNSFTLLNTINLTEPCTYLKISRGGRRYDTNPTHILTTTELTYATGSVISTKAYDSTFTSTAHANIGDASYSFELSDTQYSYVGFISIITNYTGDIYNTYYLLLQDETTYDLYYDTMDPQNPWIDNNDFTKMSGLSTASDSRVLFLDDSNNLYIYPIDPLTYKNTHLIGVAKEDITQGQYGEVVVTGIIDGLTLQYDTDYYAEPYGLLTTEVTDYYVGHSLSNTQLLVKMDHTELGSLDASDITFDDSSITPDVTGADVQTVIENLKQYVDDTKYSPIPGEIIDDYTLTASNEFILVNASENPVTITLPNPNIGNGKVYTIKVIDITNTVKVVTHDNSNILDNDNEYIFDTQYDAINIKSSGSKWWIY